MTGPIVTAVLVDTNILVHYVRRSDLYKRIEERYELTSPDRRPLVSIVTRGEIISLGLQFGWGTSRKSDAEHFLDQCITAGLDHPGVIEAYAEMDAYSLSVGRPIGDNDLWIAALARVTRTMLITTDKDFDHLSPAFINRVWIDPKSTS